MSSRRPVAYVFDSHALTSYAIQRTLVVPSLVASALGRERDIAMSSVVLADAYRELTPDQADVLDMLTGGHLATAFQVEPFDLPGARALGRRAARGAHFPLSTLHTAELASRFAAGVVTGEPEPIRALLGGDWPVLRP